MNLKTDLLGKEIEELRALKKKIELDTRKAANQVSKGNNQFWRRIFIRLLYSEIEVVIRKMKLMALHQDQEAKILSESESHLLHGKVLELKDDGKLKERNFNPKFQQDLRFTIRVFNKVFKLDWLPEYGDRHWVDFLEFIKVRNRLTHPKSPSDLDISDLESQRCEYSWGWFTDITIRQYKEMSDMIKSKTEKMVLETKRLRKELKKAHKVSKGG